MLSHDLIFNNKLHRQLQHYAVFISMKPDPIALKNALRKREAELKKIIRQMKNDNLHTSPVYKNLEEELLNVKNKLASSK